MTILFSFTFQWKTRASVQFCQLCCSLSQTYLLGVPDGMRKAVFHRFVRTDSTLSRTHSGSGMCLPRDDEFLSSERVLSGLGLAICKRLVRMMGGDCGCLPSPKSSCDQRTGQGPGCSLLVMERKSTSNIIVINHRQLVLGHIASENQV